MPRLFRRGWSGKNSRIWEQKYFGWWFSVDCSMLCDPWTPLKCPFCVRSDGHIKPQWTNIFLFSIRFGMIRHLTHIFQVLVEVTNQKCTIDLSELCEKKHGQTSEVHLCHAGNDQSNRNQERPKQVGRNTAEFPLNITQWFLFWYTTCMIQIYALLYYISVYII